VCEWQCIFKCFIFQEEMNNSNNTNMLLLVFVLLLLACQLAQLDALLIISIIHLKKKNIVADRLGQPQGQPWPAQPAGVLVCWPGWCSWPAGQLAWLRLAGLHKKAS
jgi:hypothetical protein